MFIVGELLHSNTPRVREAMEARNTNLLFALAHSQLQAGASALDVNTAMLTENEEETMVWMVTELQNRFDTIISIDTSSLSVMKAALKVHKGRAIINSLNGSHRKNDEVKSLIKDFNPKIVAMCMGDSVPVTSHDRIAAARTIIDWLLSQGVALEDMFLDAVLMPVALDPQSACSTLSALFLLHNIAPTAHKIVGLSNVSYGLPSRSLINGAFLSLAVKYGLDAVICDPLDAVVRNALLAAEVVVGKEGAMKRYLDASRAGLLE